MKSGLASSPASSTAGSPGTICSSEKETIVTPNSTGISIASRLRMYRIMDYAGVRLGFRVREARPLVAPPGLSLKNTRVQGVK